jgi:hypothetical protein
VVLNVEEKLRRLKLYPYSLFQVIAEVQSYCQAKAQKRMFKLESSHGMLIRITAGLVFSCLIAHFSLSLSLLRCFS